MLLRHLASSPRGTEQEAWNINDRPKAGGCRVQLNSRSVSSVADEVLMRPNSPMLGQMGLGLRAPSQIMVVARLLQIGASRARLHEEM